MGYFVSSQNCRKFNRNRYRSIHPAWRLSNIREWLSDGNTRFKKTYLYMKLHRKGIIKLFFEFRVVILNDLIFPSFIWMSKTRSTHSFFLPYLAKKIEWMTWFTSFILKNRSFIQNNDSVRVWELLSLIGFITNWFPENFKHSVGLDGTVNTGRLSLVKDTWEILEVSVLYGEISHKIF